MSLMVSNRSVSVQNVEPINIVMLEHRGHPDNLGITLRKFIDWRKSKGLSPAKCSTFNIFYNNPEEVEPDEYRVDICVETDIDISGNDIGLKKGVIPKGRCAVIRHIGSEDTLSNSIRYLYVDWFPNSGEEMRDFPLYVQRVNFYPDVPDNETITDIYLPLE